MNETTAVAIRGPEPVTALTPSRMFTLDQLETLKATIARGATDTEFDLFVNTCARLDLDPFRPGEIYFIKRRVKARMPDGSYEWTEVGSIQPGIEYYRQQAQANPAYDSHTPTYWCGKDGIWHDLSPSDEPPAACKVGIWRKGAREPIWGIALYKSYAQTYRDKQTGRDVPTGMWATDPAHMLSIAAEKQGIRKALPRLARQIAEHDPTLYDEQESLPTMVDVSTGEITTPEPGYKDYKDNERVMRRIHAVGRERGLGHDEIRQIVLSACNNQRKVHGFEAVTSMSELTLAELEGTAAYLDRTSSDTLRHRLTELNPPSVPVVAVVKPPVESDPFSGAPTGDLGNEPIVVDDIEPYDASKEVELLVGALMGCPELTAVDVQAEYARRYPDNPVSGTWYDYPVAAIVELTEWISNYRPAKTSSTGKRGAK